MVIYLSGMLASMLIAKYFQSIDYRYKKTYKRNISILFMALPLAVIAAIRYGVGADYFNYIDYHIPSVLHESSILGTNYIEYGYGLLIKLCIFFTCYEQSVFAVTAFIIMILFVIYIREWSISWAFSMALLVLCYTYNQSLNIMRQYVAIAIFFSSLKYVKEDNFIKYVACIVMACFMHKIALIYIPVYFLYRLDLKKRKEWSIGGFLLIGLLNGPILYVIKVLLDMIHMNLAYTSKIGSGDFSIVLLSLNLFVYILACLTRKDDCVEARIMFDTQYLAVLVSALLGVIPFGIRILYMFMPIQIVYIPYIITYSRVKEKKILRSSIVAVYLAFYFYYVLIRNFGSTLPYQTIFNW